MIKIALFHLGRVAKIRSLKMSRGLSTVDYCAVLLSNGPEHSSNMTISLQCWFLSIGSLVMLELTVTASNLQSCKWDCAVLFEGPLGALQTCKVSGDWSADCPQR